MSLHSVFHEFVLFLFYLPSFLLFILFRICFFILCPHVLPSLILMLSSFCLFSSLVLCHCLLFIFLLSSFPTFFLLYFFVSRITGLSFFSSFAVFMSLHCSLFPPVPFYSVPPLSFFSVFIITLNRLVLFCLSVYTSFIVNYFFIVYLLSRLFLLFRLTSFPLSALRSSLLWSALLFSFASLSLLLYPGVVCSFCPAYFICFSL